MNKGWFGKEGFASAVSRSLFRVRESPGETMQTNEKGWSGVWERSSGMLSSKLVMRGPPAELPVKVTRTRLLHKTPSRPGIINSPWGVGLSMEIVKPLLSPWPIPANTGHSHEAGLMLDQRRRRWVNIKPTLGECLVFAGIAYRPTDVERQKAVAELLLFAFARQYTWDMMGVRDDEHGFVRPRKFTRH